MYPQKMGGKTSPFVLLSLCAIFLLHQTEDCHLGKAEFGKSRCVSLACTSTHAMTFAGNFLSDSREFDEQTEATNEHCFPINTKFWWLCKQAPGGVNDAHPHKQSRSGKELAIFAGRISSFCFNKKRRKNFVILQCLRLLHLSLKLRINGVGGKKGEAEKAQEKGRKNFFDTTKKYIFKG